MENEVLHSSSAKPGLSNAGESDSVALLRGGSQVSSLLGAFGRGLRETRLTAFLGYLIAQHPESFRDFFGFDGDVAEVGLETTEDGGRTDILIDTPRGRCVVEAKVTASDPHKQAHRYDARWRVILSSLASAAGRGKRIRYVSWQELADHLSSLSKQKAQPFKGLCLELIHHLEEHRMIRVDPVEIYAREINNEVTLGLFLHARVYTCGFERNSRLGEAMYFAPHFGARIARLHPGVNQGISYIAKVEDVGVANSWKETYAYLLQHRGKVWYGQNKATIVESLRKRWRKNKEPLSILLLGEPRLAFNPPIRKDNLQEGKGWLSKRFFSFDELYEAWG